jgi:hypothetical protein
LGARNVQGSVILLSSSALSTKNSEFLCHGCDELGPFDPHQFYGWYEMGNSTHTITVRLRAVHPFRLLKIGVVVVDDDWQRW